MKPDTDVTKEGIYQRGLFVQRYSGIEFSLTHLLAVASFHPSYIELGDLPYSVKGKLKRFDEVLDLEGPMRPHSQTLRAMHDEFQGLEEFRRFIVHGIMLGFGTEGGILEFRLYKHIEGEAHWGTMTFAMEHMKMLTESIQPLSSAFTELVARISREMAKDFDPPDWLRVSD